MSQQDAEILRRARRARDELVDRYLDHPDVSLIDVGYAPEPREGDAEQVVLRVHVRKRWMNARPDERVTFPEQVDGIPVVVMFGEYGPEGSAGAEGDTQGQTPGPLTSGT